MTLLDLHVELAQTNQLLARIADALDRAFPIPLIPGSRVHPLVGIADVSRMTPARSGELYRRRMEGGVGNEGRFASETVASVGTQGEQPATTQKTSVTGLWDFEDGLEPEIGEPEHFNHPGG